MFGLGGAGCRDRAGQARAAFTPGQMLGDDGGGGASSAHKHPPGASRAWHRDVGGRVVVGSSG